MAQSAQSALILKVDAHEGEPCISAFDPYCKTAFGRIDCIFSLHGKRYYFYTATVDGYTDHFLLLSLHPLDPIDSYPYFCNPYYTHIPHADSSINPFVKKMFKANVGDTIELPELLAKLCETMTGE